MIALLLLSGIPFLILFTATSISVKDYLNEAIGTELSSSARNRLVQLHAMFRYSVENVQAWSMHSVMKDVLIDDVNGRIQKMLLANHQAHRLFNGAYVVNMSGKVVASTDQETLGDDVVEQSWFFDTIKSHEAQIGPLRFDMMYGGYGVSISQPIFSGEDKSKMIGILNASFSWRQLLSQLDQVDVEQIESEGSRNGVLLSGTKEDDMFIVFLDHDGYVIAAPSFVLYGDEYEDYIEGTDRYRVSDINLRRLSLQDTIKDTEAGTGFVQKKFGDREYLVGFSTTPAKLEAESGMGWYVLVFKDAKKALSPLRNLLSLFIGIGVVSVIIIYAGAVVLSNNLSRPIIKIHKWAQTVAAGKFDEPILVETNDEIGLLATSVHQLRLRIEAYIHRVSLQNQELEEKDRELDGRNQDAGDAPPTDTQT